VKKEYLNRVYGCGDDCGSKKEGERKLIDVESLNEAQPGVQKATKRRSFATMRGE